MSSRAAPEAGRTTTRPWKRAFTKMQSNRTPGKTTSGTACARSQKQRLSSSGTPSNLKYLRSRRIKAKRSKFARTSAFRVPTPCDPRPVSRVELASKRCEETAVKTKSRQFRLAQLKNGRSRFSRGAPVRMLSVSNPASQGPVERWMSLNTQLLNPVHRTSAPSAAQCQVQDTLGRRYTRRP